MNNHHEREISEHPEVQWALDLLKPDPTYDSVIKTYLPDIGCVTLAVLSVCGGNHLMRLPFYSGVHKHITGGIIGFGIAQAIKKVNDAYKAEHDTKLRDYIIRHPELFPEPEREKFADILEPWIPVR